MSAPKHTPGPWSYDQWTERVEVYNNWDDPAVCCLYRTGRGCEEEINANGRLIAAAPELLDALAELVSLIGSIRVGPLTLDELHGVNLDKYDALIRRARGIE